MNLPLPDWIESDSFELEVAKEGTLLDATEELFQALQEAEITKTELAEKLNKTPAFVSKLFRGSHNMTLKTLAEVAYTLDKRVRVKLIKKSEVEKWHNDEDSTSQKVVKIKPLYSAANDFQINNGWKSY